MQDSRKTFGQLIHEARKREGYNLRQLAALITKEDGEPITHQYLSDLENDRCNPPSDRILEELARELKISLADLYVQAKRFPPYFDVSNEAHVAAARAMMLKVIDGKLAA
jgi:transcriptional regulator with XRE-family HTH domain